MSTKLSSATALSEVRAESTKSGLGVTKGGPQAELGAKVTANAQTLSDRVLYHVFGYNAAAPNVAKRGEAIPESGPMYQATKSLVAGESDVAVTVPASSGDQTWVYVKAGGAQLERGQVIAKTAAGTYDGVEAVAAGSQSASSIAGVAQHKIPANNYGWLLVKGKGVANVSVTVGSAGIELTVTGGAGGELIADVSGSKGIGLSLDAGTTWAAVTSDATAVLLDI